MIARIFCVPSLLASLFLSACGNSDPAPQPQQPAAQPGTLFARIDNGPVVYGLVTIRNPGSFELEASRGGADMLRLQFPAVSSPNSFALGSARHVSLGLVQYGSSPRDYYTYNCQAAGGNITVTEVDQVNGTVSGTFSGRVCSSDGQTSLNVTSGTFTKIRIQ